MKQEMLTAVVVLGMVVWGAASVAQPPSAQQPHQPTPQQTPSVDVAVVPIGEAQGALMKSKLVTSQNVLAGLVRKDFDAIAAGAREMKRISEAAEWPRARDSVYEHFGKVFRQQCGQLERLAAQGNQEGVTFTYLSMTNTCVNCHDYVRDSLRLAQPNRGDVRLIPAQWPAIEGESKTTPQPSTGNRKPSE